MSAVWLIATSVALYIQKAIGVAVPASVLDRGWIRRVLALLPVALLAALTATQTFVQTAGSNVGLVIDARVAGVAAAAVALALRAPFLVVVVVAALTAAGVRALA